MNINKKQKAVILLGTGVMVFIGLIPPWFHTVQQIGHPKEEQSSVYSPIYKPPRPKVYEYMDSFLANKTVTTQTYKAFQENTNWGVRLDTERLLVQWAMVALVIVAFFLVLADKKPKN